MPSHLMSDQPDDPRAGVQRLLLTLACCIGVPAGTLTLMFAAPANPVWAWPGGVILAMGALAAGLLRLPRFQCPEKMRPAARRYFRRQLAAMAAYMVLILAAVWLRGHGLASGPLGYVVALAPAVPIIGLVVLLQRYVREETDEVMRHVILSAMAWSGALTLCEATTWGFLETFDLAPHVWMWAAPVAFFAQIGLTTPLAMRRVM